MSICWHLDILSRKSNCVAFLMLQRMELPLKHASLTTAWLVLCLLLLLLLPPAFLATGRLLALTLLETSFVFAFDERFPVLTSFPGRAMMMLTKLCLCFLCRRVEGTVAMRRDEWQEGADPGTYNGQFCSGSLFIINWFSKTTRWELLGSGVQHSGHFFSPL